MVVCAPITINMTENENGPFHPAFMQDWQIIHNIFHEQSICIHTKPSALTCNGRSCFFAITDYIMGKEAAKHLFALKYNRSKTKNWNFEKYCNKHIKLVRKWHPPI